MLGAHATFASIFGSVGDALGLFAVAIGLVGVAAGAVGYFAKGRGDSIIEYLTKENSVVKDANAGLEKTLAARTAERDSLQRENDTLKSLAQGSPELVKLTSEIKRLVAAVSKQNGGRSR